MPYRYFLAVILYCLPGEIYLNVEQRPKSASNTVLLQENIDKAFKQHPRVTNNISRWNDYQIYLLNGMHTGLLGVVTSHFPRVENCRLSGLERTLIDIAVRPAYSGGVASV